MKSRDIIKFSDWVSVLILVFITTVSNELHAKKWIVDKHHPVSSIKKPKGTYEAPFRTISEAAVVAMPGDTVLVYQGIYRERVTPARGGKKNQRIVYMAADGKEVIIKGSEVWPNTWQPHSNHSHIYRSSLPMDKLTDYNPFYIQLARMEPRLSLGQLFVNGERMVQVDSIKQLKITDGSWMLSYDSTELFLHIPQSLPGKSLANTMIEFSVRDKVFAPHIRGLGYIEVNGFIIEHCANQFPSGFYRMEGHPQAGALSTRSGHHWIIKNNIIRHAKSLGIDCGAEGDRDLEGNQPTPPYDSIGYHLIEKNVISFNGAGGIAGAHQRNSIIRYNIIEHNNYLGHTAPETGGIKVHFFYDGLIKGNLLRHNDCNGIWLDNVWYGSRVTGNTLINNKGQGIFVEMGYGPCLVDNNIIAFTRLGDGIYMHDASGVTIAHNFLYGNQHFGCYARIVTERKTTNHYTGERELVATKKNQILNNVFVDNYRGHISLPLDDGERVFDNYSDYNLFINGAQWQWEGLGFNSFTIGNNDGRIPDNKMATALEETLKKNNVPDHKWPNFELWINQPLLTKKWWQLMTGNDVNSHFPEIHTGNIEVGAIAKGLLSLSIYDLRMNIRNGTTFKQLKVPALEYVAFDFYGNEIKKGKVLPGPFQHYEHDFTRFYLKPDKNLDQ